MRKAAFARLLGITAGAVQSAVKSGNISLTRDKMVNTQHPKNIRYAQECRARKEKLAKGQNEEKKKAENSGWVKSDTIQQKANASGNEASEGELVDPGENLKADYQIAKLQAQTRSLEIKNAVALHMLLDRKFVDAAIGRIASVIANHMLTMGDRISADCAAACGALTPENKIAVKQLIDKDTTRSIQAMKSEIEKHYYTKVDENE